jgi:hypothetical protein
MDIGVLAGGSRGRRNNQKSKDFYPARDKVVDQFLRAVKMCTRNLLCAFCSATGDIVSRCNLEMQERRFRDGSTNLARQETLRCSDVGFFRNQCRGNLAGYDIADLAMCRRARSGEPRPASWADTV